MLDCICKFLFIDQVKGHMSHTKFWSNVGYGLIAWSFVYSIVENTPLDTTMVLIVGGILVGNRTAKGLLEKKV